MLQVLQSVNSAPLVLSLDGNILLITVAAVLLVPIQEQELLSVQTAMLDITAPVESVFAVCVLRQLMVKLLDWELVHPVQLVSGALLGVLHAKRVLRVPTALLVIALAHALRALLVASVQLSQPQLNVHWERGAPLVNQCVPTVQLDLLPI